MVNLRRGLIAFFIFSLLLSGCSRNKPVIDTASQTKISDTPSPTEVQSSSESTAKSDENYKTWLQEQIDKDVYSCSAAEIKDNMEKWIMDYIKERYKDLEIQDKSKAVYVSSGSFSEPYNGYSIRSFNFLCRVITSKPSQKSIKQEDGSFVLEYNIYPVAVEYQGKASLAGIIDSYEIRNFEVLQEAYKIVYGSKKYSGAFPKFPEPENSDAISYMNLSKIINDSGYPTCRHVLPGDRLAVLTVADADREKDGGYNLSRIYIVDLKNRRAADKPIEIEPCTYSRVYSQGDSLFIDIYQNDGRDIKTLEVNTNTYSVSEKNDFKGMRNPVFSPDGTKIAYSKNGNLYVCSSTLKNPRMLVKGNNSQGEDGKSCYPVNWADNDRIIYNIAGYEWSEGCGFVSITDGKAHPFTNAGKSAAVVYSSGSRVFTSTGEMGASFDPGFIDINDDKLTFKKVFSKEFSLNFGNEGNLSYGFSPDGSRLALLKQPMSPYDKSVLYICSTNDGSVVKKIEFSSGVCGFQYVSFIENDRLLIIADRYAFSSEYCLMVDLKGF